MYPNSNQLIDRQPDHALAKESLVTRAHRETHRTNKRTNHVFTWWNEGENGESKKEGSEQRVEGDGGLSAGGIQREESVIPDDQRAADSALMSSSNDK